MPITWEATSMNHFRDAAREHGVPLTVCGWNCLGDSLHGEERPVGTGYARRRSREVCICIAWLRSGFNTLPDGRFYVSVVHKEDDITETAHAIHRVQRTGIEGNHQNHDRRGASDYGCGRVLGGSVLAPIVDELDL